MATTKKTAAKRTAKKPARVAPPIVETPQDLTERWPGGLVDNLPEDVRLAILALEWLVVNSKNPRKAINRLHVLVSGVRLSPLAAYVSEIRLTGYHKGFVDGVLKLMAKGGAK